jgi:hypothetical protein
MCVQGVISDIFGGADQLLVEGDELAKVLVDHFVWRWSRGGELPQDLSAAEFH